MERERVRVFGRGVAIGRVLVGGFSVAMMLAVTFVAQAVASAYNWRLGSIIVGGTMVFGTGACVYFCIHQWKQWKKERRRLRGVIMRRLGWRICGECDYDIGRDGPAVCPECGTAWSEGSALG